MEKAKMGQYAEGEKAEVEPAVRSEAGIWTAEVDADGGKRRQDAVEEMDLYGGERKRKKRRTGKDAYGRRKERRLTGCMAAKIAAFFLLGISFLLGTVSMGLCAHLVEYGMYTLDSQSELLSDVLYGESRNLVEDVIEFLKQGEAEEAVYFCQDKNIDISMAQADKEGRKTTIWTTGKGYASDITMDMYFDFWPMSEEVVLNGHTLKAGTRYWFHVSIDPEFAQEDVLKKQKELITAVYDARFLVIQVAAASVFVFLLSFIFLMCSAGRRNGREGITPSVLTGIPLDVLTVIFGGAAVFFAYVYGEVILYNARDFALICLLAAGGTVLAVWCTVFFMEVALRLKQGNCLRHTLIYTVLRWIGRLLRILGRMFKALLDHLPLIVTTLCVYFGICLVEIIVLARYTRFYSGGAALWLFGKLLLLIPILYIALVFRKLLEGSRALAEGKEDYRVDTKIMFGGFREHGENLNSLGQGISRAVAERMRSEHLKTELITNVSHDIKTPLTSIINYADLLWAEISGVTGVPDSVGIQAGAAAETQQPADETAKDGMQPSGCAVEKQEAQALSMETAKQARIAEYVQVLLRQSRRMKKLLEDLVEASKATTGNLEVNLEPCEAGVLLSQAVGEYQQRMEEKNLELIVRQTQDSVKIMADGRHLWRVFDNLLNNICKYAQEGSRVYLSMEVKEGRVQIVFRNMSKYPLDIPPQELEERFVRGDKSRHMEGNGLGLSISKSLIELLGGRMEIVTDGDLFKVILDFALYKEKLIPHR